MKSKFSTTIIFLTLALTRLAAAQTTAPLSVTSLSYAGTGCPANTLRVAMSPDGSSFTLLFDAMVAAVGPGVPAAEASVSCQLALVLAPQPGWSLAVTSVDLRGYVQLDAKLTAREQVRYYFTGERHVNTPELQLRGPLDQDYLERDALHGNGNNLGYAGCGGSATFNVGVDASIAAQGHGGGQGLFTVDTADGNVAQVYHVAWQRCR